MALANAPNTNYIPSNGIVPTDFNDIGQNLISLEGSKVEQLTLPVTGDLVQQTGDGNIEKTGLPSAYIDQDVSQDGNPTFNNANVTNTLSADKVNVNSGIVISGNLTRGTFVLNALSETTLPTGVYTFLEVDTNVFLASTTAPEKLLSSASLVGATIFSDGSGEWVLQNTDISANTVHYMTMT